uniref:Uncharacterized protein n=1 Tax=Cynoglossus semilaevis TaxID=244447 RepID=A0A3P8VWB2_CYNSE
RLSVCILIIIGVQHHSHKRVKRENTKATNDSKCLKNYGGITFEYIFGKTMAYTFDLCSVINYIWDQVKIQRDYSTTQNPITISLNWTKLPTGSNWKLSGKTNQTEIYLVLGVDQTRTDPMGFIRVVIRNEITKHDATLSTSVTQSPDEEMEIITEYYTQTAGKNVEVIAVDYTSLTPKDIMTMATGYTTENLWSKWLMNTAKENSADDCVACASARPQLFTEPAPLFPNDTWGYNCMLKLTHEATPLNCTTLASISPPIANKTRTGAFTPHKGKGHYVCFTYTHSNPKVYMGKIDPSWCKVTMSGSMIGRWGRAGLYHYCGEQRLLIQIPSKAVGICAIVRLGAPLVIIGQNKLVPVGITPHLGATLTRKRKRHMLEKRDANSFDLTLNSPNYIDAIGVPRGIPNEYKLQDQVAAGFASLPIISAIFPVQPNKNVDFINYVHFNVLRLTNLIVQKGASK